MKKSFSVFFLIFTIVFNSWCISYDEKVKSEKDKMNSTFRDFIESLSEGKPDYSLLEDYLSSSENYIHTVSERPYFFIDKSFALENISVSYVNMLGERLVLSDINNIYICRIKEGKVQLLSSAEDIGEIIFIDVMDSDFDGREEIFTITDQGMKKFVYSDGRLQRKSRDENIYNMVSLHKGRLDGKSDKIIGRVAEIDDPIYGIMMERLYRFSWIFPGFDRKSELIPYDLKGNIIRFVDFNRDGALDIATIFEKAGNTVVRIFFNDRFNNFEKKREFSFGLSGLADAVFYRSDVLYLLMNNGIQRIEIEDDDLIIKENFFSINGCAGFKLLNEDEFYLLRADNTLNHLLKLNQGGRR
ncbi:MAG: hypothetical protein ACOCWO_00070, partial [Candidatus Muiribacteriaceae bacterium]